MKPIEVFRQELYQLITDFVKSEYGREYVHKFDINIHDDETMGNDKTDEYNEPKTYISIHVRILNEKPKYDE